jgi:sec-independent protein translocase protein TatA
MPFGVGIWEIVILAVVLVLLFGSKGAPAMARRLGTGVRELKDAVGEMDPRTLLDSKGERPPQAAPPRELEAVKPAVADAEVAVALEADEPADEEPAAS